MNLGMDGLVFLVSGGGSGIGQAVTRQCLEEGATVVVAGRHTPEVMAFETEMKASVSSRCRFFQAELADPRQCEAAIAFVRDSFGRLDGLVNNAGANDNVGLETGNPLRFEESLRQNLLHYYSLAHFALPMLKESHGSIVNISSKVAVTGQGGTSAYAAAKGAQLALTREWAAELLPYGIRVNAVVPAEVVTPLYEQWLAQQHGGTGLATVGARVPLQHRMTRASEIASAVAFLLSPTQSAHTTAQHVFVDGGYTHLDRALTSGADAT
ncbi:L-fucose dehydrogenase [Terriglobus roseus]|uniref:L-fucose dehydrogenase n=2 Tax=Terriglobus roseus TaxID=392734 RepID=A0A1H4SC40_9BACT|nr:L-fucose dehydrogenase [Terriglobus roseus]